MTRHLAAVGILGLVVAACGGDDENVAAPMDATLETEDVASDAGNEAASTPDPGAAADDLPSPTDLPDSGMGSDSSNAGTDDVPPAPDSVDAGQKVPDTGSVTETTGTGPTQPSCEEYCTAVQAVCGPAAAQYDSQATCLAHCQAAAWQPGGSDDVAVNTVACRLHYATLAAASEEAACDHCPAAGPHGGGVCGSWCESYCWLAAQSCTGTDELFADEAACLAACAAYPACEVDGTTIGDTVQCRLHQLVVAGVEDDGESVAGYCVNAGPSGGQTCVDPTAPASDPGDTCDTPIVVDALPFETTVSSGAFYEAVDPAGCSAPDPVAQIADVVFAYEPESSGYYEIELQSADPNLPAWSLAYVVSDCDDVQGSCKGWTAPPDGQLSVQLEAGTTYRIVVELTWDPAGLPEICKPAGCGTGQGQPTPSLTVGMKAVCSDECDADGAKECAGGAAKSCGNHDGDPCLEWQEQSCGGCGCQNGECQNQGANGTTCQSGDVWWTDCNAQPSSKKEDCGGCGCVGGQCGYQDQVGTTCQGGNVWWTDCNGDSNSQKEYCGTCGCSNGQCGDQDYVGETCQGGDVWWTDCNGQPSSKKEDCGGCGCSGAQCQVPPHYWEPPQDLETDPSGKQYDAMIPVPIRVEVAEEGKGLRFRVCKIGDDFVENVFFEIQDTVSGPASIVVPTLSTTGKPCSSWQGLNNDTGYLPGQKFIGKWQVVSPSTSATDWSSGCTPTGVAGGACWNGNDIVLTRTCKGL